MECALVVQAVAVASFGPLAPNRMETCPAARFTMAAGMKNGEILRGPPFEQRPVLALDHVESADAGADVHADTFGVLGRDLQAAGLHRFIRRREGEVDEAAHFLDFFFLDEIQRVEVLDLGGNLARVSGGVELGDSSDAALAREQVLPDFLRGVADSTDQANAGNYDPPRQTYFPPFECLPM